jgi:quercetin dioxygenase-like cupin family protein
MNSKLAKLSRCAILSALAFGIIAMPYGLGNPTFAQEQTQQQQDHQSAPIIGQNTSEPMQDPSQGSETNQTSNMEIKRAGSQPSTVGSAEYFTGSVRIDPVFEAKDPSRLVVATVTFEPGAHTAWHIHPLGQILIVTAGCGLIQTGDDPVEEICPGDVIWTQPGERHWHGASPTTGMTHIAIQEHLNGTAANWMEKVSDEQYPGR